MLVPRNIARPKLNYQWNNLLFLPCIIMKKLNIILLLFILGTLFSQCKKDEEDWTYCLDCEPAEWVGYYEGTGNYYRESDSTNIMDVPTEITIDSISEIKLRVTIVADKYFSSTTMIYKDNNDYYVEVAGSSKSLSLSLSKRGNEYKLSGTSKRYHYEHDTILIIDQSHSFETFKVQE